MIEKPEVIFEDSDIIVVNKPNGLTVIPDRIHTERATVQSILEKEYGKLFVVHRIDRGTSGVLCFARNEAAHRNLSLQFQNHTVKKIYRAIVKGRLKQKSGVIDAPIAENTVRPGTMLIHKRGKDISYIDIRKKITSTTSSIRKTINDRGVIVCKVVLSAHY